jgi:putative spermidine/putrescine transport system ATP-binding protein
VLTLTVRSGGRRLQVDLPTHAGALSREGDRVTVIVAREDLTLVGLPA